MADGLDIKLRKHETALWGRATRDPKWRQEDGCIVHIKSGTRMRMLPGGKWQTMRPFRG